MRVATPGGQHQGGHSHPVCLVGLGVAWEQPVGSRKTQHGESREGRLHTWSRKPGQRLRASPEDTARHQGTGLTGSPGPGVCRTSAWLALGSAASCLLQAQENPECIQGPVASYQGHQVTHCAETDFFLILLDNFQSG